MGFVIQVCAKHWLTIKILLLTYFFKSLQQINYFKFYHNLKPS